MTRLDHGGGRWGVNDCHCAPCRARRCASRAEDRTRRHQQAQKPALAVWEVYEGTPTRKELLEAR